MAGRVEAELGRDADVPDKMHYSADDFLCGESLSIQDSRIRRLICERSGQTGRPLHDKPPVVKQQSAQPSQFLAASRPPRPAMQATRNHISVPGVLRPDTRVDRHDAAMQIADSQHHTLQKFRIICENRRHERPQSTPRQRDRILCRIIGD